MRYRRRLANYRSFRRRLPVPLLTVELAFDSGFELDAGDADILIQRHGGAVLWQKERLLNIALQSLPAECTQIAWLDCDISFERSDWPVRVAEALARFALVQPFHHFHHLPPDTGAAEATRESAILNGPSVAAALASGQARDTLFRRVADREPGCASPGLAWAASRELLERHGFYDASIVGGGDTAMACAAFGAWKYAIEVHRMNAWQRARYLDWARPFYEAVRGAVTFVEGDIFHLWHGAIEDRRGRARHAGLAHFDFDPATDIAIGEDGCWRWATDKPQLHRYVRDYFASRRDDGYEDESG